MVSWAAEAVPLGLQIVILSTEAGWCCLAGLVLVVKFDDVFIVAGAALVLSTTY